MINQKEIWKPVVGYKGIYEVSNMGRLKSLSKTIKNSKNRVYNTKERFFKKTLSKSGYCVASLWKNGKLTSSARVHRLVMIAFVPNPIDKPFVNHINGIKTDNRVENLEWCTAKENSIHAVKNGLLNNSSALGEKHNYFKLTFNQVIEIRNLRNLGLSNKEIGEKFSVSTDHVSKIINFKERISA